MMVCMFEVFVTATNKTYIFLTVVYVSIRLKTLFTTLFKNKLKLDGNILQIWFIRKYKARPSVNLLWIWIHCVLRMTQIKKSKRSDNSEKNPVLFVAVIYQQKLRTCSMNDI